MAHSQLYRVASNTVTCVTIPIKQFPIFSSDWLSFLVIRCSSFLSSFSIIHCCSSSFVVTEQILNLLKIN